MKHNVVLTKSYGALPICEQEVLRYAGDKTSQNEILSQCLQVWQGKEDHKVCYVALPLEIKGDLCDFGVFSVSSADLAKHLTGCCEVLLFGATIGISIDRLITKYSALSPVKALFYQAIGAQQIEALCDAFCTELADEHGLLCTRRFSPGYGDLPLQTQRDIFRVLDCEKRIGLTLNGSMLMTPTKSVTAFVGIRVPG